MIRDTLKTASAAAVTAAALGISGTVSAELFDDGIPAGWECEGNCGTSGADGVVSLAPGGGDQYGWVSTDDGVSGAGELEGIGDGETNGSELLSAPFSAEAGEPLDFEFNYVTSDGAGFADYAWARLVDTGLNEVALLFTARTVPEGSIVPGTGMPDPEATLDPEEVEIIGGGPEWSPLGGSSGACFDEGCGYTDWVGSSYEIAAAGNYQLQFGVTNWNDTAFDSGMAFDGITVGGDPISEEPPTNGEQPPPVAVAEPAAWGMLGIGLLALASIGRRRNLDA